MRIQLQNIHKSYGAVEVVKGLDIDIADGEFLVLLGESGCGKSTVLRMIAGLESLSSGRIMIGPRDVSEVLPKFRNVAMVFQSYALYPHMTVAENIGYPLKLQKKPPEKLQQAVLAAATKVHLDGYLERMPRQLSGGQRQRVALARAIIRTPSVFLLDEPLSNLDAKLRGAMRAELKRLQSDLGITTIHVTHDQIEAMTLAHRVAVMSNGILEQIAPPKEIYDNPATKFVARFIGSPAMNIVPGNIADGVCSIQDGRVPISGLVPRGRVLFGFRPEDSTIVPATEGMLKARVFSTEMTGSETIVTCQIGTNKIIVRMDKDCAVQPDEYVGINLNTAKARLFDPADGHRIRT